VHQALHRAARHGDALAGGLSPDLLRPIHREVLVPNPANLLPQPLVPLRAFGPPIGIPAPSPVLVVSGRGDRQHGADRLDPVQTPILVDEGHHHFGRRSSSARAKQADALRRISLALPVLTLKLLEPLTLGCREAGARPSISLRLPDPPPQRLRRAANLPRDRSDRVPL
jgi:hypothetical protein